MESLDKLKEKINSSPYLKETDLSILLIHYVRQVELEFQNWEKRSISWSTEDFVSRAKDMYGNNWEQYFDKELFEEQLYEMMRHHDANFGITWGHIDAYLDNCKK